MDASASSEESAFFSVSFSSSGVGVTVSSSASPAPSFSVCALSLAASVALFLEPQPPSMDVVRKTPNKIYAVFFFHVKFLYIPLPEV